MSLLSRLERARRILVQNGLPELIRAVRGYGRPYEYFVYRRVLACEESDGSRGGAVEAGSLLELRRWRDSQEHVPAPFLGDRTSGWRDFYWAWRDDHPVGIVWIAAKSPLLLTGAEEAVIVDLYTSPAFRGRGIAPALIEAACQHLRQRGLRAAYATVQTRNTPSRRAFERSGFEVIGEFKVRGWLRRPPSTTRWIHQSGARESR